MYDDPSIRDLYEAVREMREFSAQMAAGFRAWLTAAQQLGPLRCERCGHDRFRHTPGALPAVWAFAVACDRCGWVYGEHKA